MGVVHRIVLSILLLLLPGSGYAEPTQFPSVQKMMESFRDYPIENNQFKVLSEKPLHVRFSPLVFKEDCSTVTDDSSRRAMLFGIYRTFIHTPAKEVKVTVVPLDHTTHKLLDAYSVSASMNRDKALALAHLHLGAKSLDELVENQQASGIELKDRWSHLFNKALFEERGPPGLNLFFQEIMGKKKSNKTKKK